VDTKELDPVKIGPFTFEVHSVGSLEGNAIGDVSYNQCRIRIADTCKQVRQETLLHECLHMLFYVSGRCDLADDEGLISALSPLMLQFLRDNVDTINYLLDD
jgi:hypothetical protein